MEQWRIIEADPRYSVSTIGRIKNNSTGHIKAVRTHNGYSVVYLNKRYRIHRLVAEAFIPNPNNYPIINHKNEKKGDNRVENLEWCTHQYNCAYGTRNERIGKTLCMQNHNGKRIIIDDIEYPSYCKAIIETGIPESIIARKKTEYKGHKIKYIANDN